MNNYLVGESIKDIGIPGFGQAYNGSLVSFGSEFLLVYRRNLSNVNCSGSDYIEYTWLDENFDTNATTEKINLYNTLYEDARVFQEGAKLEIFVGGPAHKQADWRERAVYSFTCMLSGRKLIEVSPPKKLIAPGGNARCEKNWILFKPSREDSEYILYSLSPLRIFRRDKGIAIYSEVGCCGTVIDHQNHPVSCGSNLLEIEVNVFICFYHSVHFPFLHMGRNEEIASKNLSHTRIYYFGACLIRKVDNNFVVDSFSEEPLTYQRMYDCKNERVNRPEFVVFPMTIFYLGDRSNIYLLISENDSIMKVIRYDQNKLLNSLRKLSAKSEVVESIHNRPVPCSI